MNKKAFSLSGWAEIALMVTLFSLLFIGLIAEMNVKYNKNIDGSFGLQNLATNTQNNMSAYQETLQQSLSEGTSASTGLGVSLSTTWNIINAGATIVWNFLTGGYIEQLCALVGLPMIVGNILRVLFVLSIGFIVLRLVLKIKP